MEKANMKPMFKLLSAKSYQNYKNMVKIQYVCIQNRAFHGSSRLQLGLPVDGRIVTGSVHAANWRDECEKLLDPKATTRLGIHPYDYRGSPNAR
ncbi:hypothetical protein Gotur_010126 [Gossypium turneri]